VSALSLLVLAPLLLAVAALVKLTSPGPVFFTQERVGLDRRARSRRNGTVVPLARERRSDERRRQVKYGKPFMMYKFRTMVAGAEKGRPIWAQKHDPRITPLGRFMRRTRVDEIPQFFNVLKGDMSIVGPRPERAFFIDEAAQDVPDFRLRLRAKPGITGLAQISLGYTNSISGMTEKLRYDLEYIDRMSLKTDVSILLKTVGVILTGKGAC